MGIVFKNNAKTTLASSLSNSATSATVTDGSVFPSLSAGEFFLLTFDDGTNNEICKCTARSGNTLTIVRAQESTTARAFSSGDAAEGRVTAGVLETIQENIAAKSANQTVYNTTTASSATDYDIGIDPSVEANAMVFLNGVMQHHDTFSFSGSTLTFDAAPPNGMALEVIVDNLINLQSSNLTVDTFTATSGQTDFVLSDTPAAETNLIVFVDGVFQDQDSYTISNNTLTITDGVVLDRGVTVYVINPVNIGTPSDGTVTSAKLSGNITMPGTLTVGSNDVAFDSPTFVVDNANSRVGLGTASPSVPVDIVGDVKMSANLTVDTSTLVVDSTNNRVGIGTTSPADKLDVIVDATGGLKLGTNADAGVTLTSYQGSTNSNVRNIDFNVQNFVVNTGSPTGTTVSEAFRVTNDGNVGIGTDNPSYKADIQSNSNTLIQTTGIVSGGATALNLRQSRGSLSSPTNSSTNGDGNYIVSQIYRDAGYNSNAWIGLVTDANADDGRIVFGTASSGTVAEKVRIDASGNVGINETSPDGELHVKGTGGGNGDIYVERTSGAKIHLQAQSANGKIGTATNHNLGLNTNGTTRITIDTNGNVGIAATSPSEKLEVDGGVKISNANSRLYFGTEGGTSYRALEGSTSGSLLQVGEGYTDIALQGNVGIGETSPDNILHIKTTASGGPQIQMGDGTNYGFINFDGTSLQISTQRDMVDGTWYNTAKSWGGINIIGGTGGSEITMTTATGPNTAPVARCKLDQNGRFYFGGTSSYAHNTYGHKLVVTGNSIPNGVAVIEDSDVSSGIGNTVLNLFFRDQDPATAAVFIDFRDGGGRVGSVTHNDDGGGVTYNTTSDYRLKENVNYTWDALSLLTQLKPAKFNFIGKTDKTRQGFLAHEVMDIVPGSVKGEKDHIEPVGTITDNDGNVVDEGVYEHFCKTDEGQTWTRTGEEPVYQQLDYSRIVPLLTKAIQEQQEQIETLKQEIREIREGG